MSSVGRVLVHVSGATGRHSACINGAYESTSEVAGGFAVYMKRGDSGICIEHNNCMWQIKHVSEKGTHHCMAMITGGDVLQACALRLWRVYDERRLNERTVFVFTEQPNVKMLTGMDAERKVRSSTVLLECQHSHPVFLNISRPKLMPSLLPKTIFERL